MNSSASLYGECRCCLALGDHRDIMKEYFHDGHREVYFDMFLECFNVFLSTPSSANLICEKCVARLRDANAFRIMVVNAEKNLHDACKRYQLPDENPPDIKYELVSDVKVEESPDFTEADNEDLASASHTPVMKYDAANPPAPLTPDKTNDCSMMLECDFCLKEFASTAQLIAHIAEHSVDDDVNDKRTEVNAGPSSQKAKDQTRKVYVCTYCDKQYKHVKAFKKHLTDHTGSSRRYVCTFCGQRFQCRGSLTRHKGRHNTDMPHSCSFCKKQFATNFELKRHDLVHTKEKPYLCDNCGKGFTHKEYLVDHLNLHAGVKAYRCTGCKRKFTHGYQHTWHMKKCKAYKKKN